VQLANAVVNNITMSAVTLGSPGNSNVKPERQAEFETGFDATAAGGRVNAELTYYSRKSRDALLLLALPVSAGGGSRYVNVGSVSNRGFEGLLTARLLDRRSTTFDLSLNGSINTNRLVSRDSAADAAPLQAGFTGTTIAAGYPLYGLWARPILGYADANGNGIIEPGEVTVGDTAVYFGPSLPTKQLTAIGTLSLFHNAVRTNVLFDWRGGFKRMSYDLWTRCSIVLNCRESYDRNTPLSEQAKTVAYNTTGTISGFIYDASFLRLREVSVTLRAPTWMSRAARATEGSITFAGRNLAFWSKYPDGDPEINSSIGSDQIDTSPTTPMGRYWIARINLSY
jgi:hypothetical protein